MKINKSQTDYHRYQNLIIRGYIENYNRVQRIITTLKKCQLLAGENQYLWFKTELRIREKKEVSELLLKTIAAKVHELPE